MTELEDFNTPLLVKILIYYKYASVFIYEKNVFICSDHFKGGSAKSGENIFLRGWRSAPRGGS